MNPELTAGYAPSSVWQLKHFNKKGKAKLTRIALIKNMNTM